MWLRLYTDTRDDPKVQRLPGETFKQWVNLLCLAKEHDGLLPSTEDIAFKLRMTDADAKCLVEELVKRNLLDITDEGIAPHNWDNRQFLSDDDPTAAIRARRYRQRNVTRDATSDVTSDLTEASHPSEQRQSRAETETEQSRGGSGGNPSPVASRAKRAAASRRVTTCDEEFLEELQQNPAYAMFNVRLLYHKMVAWCKNAGKQPTRGRFINWLNKEDKPMTAKASPPKNPAAQVGKSAPLPVETAPTDHEFMAVYVDDLIAIDDLIHIGQEYDAIIERGGPKAEWEIRCVAYYELHKNEPATPEQVAQLNASINTLANKR